MKKIAPDLITLTVILLVLAIAVFSACQPRNVENLFDYKAKTITIADDKGNVWSCLEVNVDLSLNPIFNCTNIGKVIKTQ